MAEYNLSYTGQQVDNLLDKINDLGNATPQEAGLMSAADKTKLDGIASGAQANVLEGVKLGGTALTPTDKVVNIPMDDAPTEGSNNPVKSGALKTALDAKGTYSKPSGGIPKSDLASGVQTSLDKADAAAPQSTTYTKTEVDNKVSVKADKDTDAGIGNLAEFDSNGNPVDSGISAADVDKKGSYDENAVVGASEGLIDPNLAGGEQSMVGIRAFSGKNGLAEIKQIEGKTVAWNQLTQKDWLVSGETKNAVTLTNNNDGSLSTSGTASANTEFAVFTTTKTLVDGHKYFIKGCPSGGSNSTYFLNAWVNNSVTLLDSDYGSGILVTWQSSYVNINLYITIKVGKAAPTQRWYPQIFDLTLMGIDNLTTVAEVEAWLAANVGLKPYYPYDAGSLLNNDADAIVARGRNVWDEEWENGYYSGVTGAFNPVSGEYCTKNAIPIFPSTTYYIKRSGATNDVIFYDSEGNFISSQQVSPNSTFTTPANARMMQANFGTTRPNEFCINISDASFNGQYEPYKRVEKSLNLKEIKVKSPNIWDEEWELGSYTNTGEKYLRNDAIRSTNKIPVSPNTEYYHLQTFSGIAFYDANGNALPSDTFISNSVQGVFTTPAGACFMTFYQASVTTYNHDITINLSGWANGRYFPHGILTFNGLREAGAVKDYETKTHLHRKVGDVDLGSLEWLYDSDDWYYCGLSDKKLGTNMVCSAYPTGEMLVGYETIGAWPHAYNTTVYFRTQRNIQDAMSGVMLNYELANEEVYELAEPFNGVYRVFEGGTEEVVNSHLSAAFLATIAYNEDINERLLDLSKPGFCKGLVDTRSAGTRQGPFAFRQSGGDGVNYMRKILGRTEAWNQLGRNLKPSGTYYGITLATNADGSFSVSGMASEVLYFDFYDSRNDGNIISGHKYYIGCGLSGGTGETYCIYDRGTFAYISDGRGVILTGAGSIFVPAFRISTGVSVDFNVYPQLIDLTLLYGSEIDGLTDAEILAKFRALHPLPYYNYNAGVLKNNAATRLETVGFNQWDEEWEVGDMDQADGSLVPANDRIRCKNYIPVIAGSTYYCASAYVAYLIFYDSNYNHLSSTQMGYFGNYTATAPSNAAYARFYCVPTYGTTYNHDICINRSDASRNGIYEPYWKREIVLGLDNLACHDENNNAVVVNGLDGVETSYDEAVVENGYVTKIIKRVGSVDLGNLNWEYVTTHWAETWAPFFRSAISDSKPTGSTLICERYAYIPNLGGKDKSISSMAVDFEHQISIKDSAYTDAATFKAAMDGVKLRYELATPKMLTLDNPIPALIEVDNLGTEKRLPEDTADNPQAPFECDSNYSISVANLVRKLNS